MEGKKIIKMPITYTERKLNEMGNGYVPCQVSERWIQFPENTTDYRFIPIEIMTIGKDEKPKKICEMIMNRDDIVRAVNAVKSK